MVMKAMIDYLKKLREKLDLDARWIYITILGFILLFVLIVLPSSFAGIQPVRQIEIFSEKLNYNNGEPGAWKITKSAKWTGRDEAEITIDVDSVTQSNQKKVDVLFLVDSSSTESDNFKALQNGISNSINSIFNSDNRVGIVTFNDTYDIVSNFTNDKEELNNKINSISTIGNRNFYQAFKGVENVLKSYEKEEGRDCVIIFIASGYTNIDKNNELAQYSYLKNKYPFLTVNALQHMMGSTLNDSFKNISDRQYITNNSNLVTTIIDASGTSREYENFKITDYVNTNYFSIEKNYSESGEVTLSEDEQKIDWNINNYKSGQKLKLTIKVKLREEFKNLGGIYPTNDKTEITSAIDNVLEYLSSGDTPVLSDNYNVTYDGNAPSGCRIDTVPAEEKYFVFDTVDLSDEIPKCEGYQFKGWEISTDNVAMINEDYFTMPEENVEIKGVWAKLNIKKSMNGTIGEALTLYRQVELDTSDSNKYAKKYSGTTNTFNGNENVYYYYGAATNNNVIFANFCWKIVRTTDTGGVKLLYNGVASSSRTCNNTGENAQLTAQDMNLTTNKSPLNINTNSLADSGYMYNTRYESNSMNMVGTQYKYGNSFTYTNGVYTLVNTKNVSNWSNEFYANNGHLDNYHYTCFNTTGTCSEISFLFETTPTLTYYIKLSGGKSVKNALDEMLYNDGVNVYDSTIKKAIDYWFSNHMMDYTEYLEDTVWCNDRNTTELVRLNDKYSHGFNPNNGSLNTELYFKSIEIERGVTNNNLDCSNKNDRFTVHAENGNGALTYPVGLMTIQEIIFAYDGTKSPLASGELYWLMTPSIFGHWYGGPYEFIPRGRAYLSATQGGMGREAIENEAGVRPSVSLRQSIEYSSGDGSADNPYIISMD